MLKDISNFKYNKLFRKERIALIKIKKFIKNRLILKKQLTFKSVNLNVFTEEINWTALSSNDDKRLKSIDLVETYPHGMNKEFIWEKEKIKYTCMIKQYKNA